MTGASPDAGLGLDEDADLARRADIAFGTPAFGRIVQRSGVDGRLLARTALAWRYGGQTGLETLTSGWNPHEEQPDAADLLKGAVTALRGATGEPAYVVANKVTAGRVQVRLGPDLLWYPYLSPAMTGEPAGPPHADPYELSRSRGSPAPIVSADFRTAVSASISGKLEAERVSTHQGTGSTPEPGRAGRGGGCRSCPCR